MRNRWDENRAIYDVDFRQRWLDAQNHPDGAALWLVRWEPFLRNVTAEEAEMIAYGKGEGAKNAPKEDPFFEEDPKLKNGSENLQGDLPSQPGGTRPNRSMHQHTKGEVPQEPVLEDEKAGKDKLHAQEQKFIDVTRSGNLSKSHRAKLRESVDFLPEDGTEMVTGPSPIECLEPVLSWRTGCR